MSWFPRILSAILWTVTGLGLILRYMGSVAPDMGALYHVPLVVAAGLEPADVYAGGHPVLVDPSPQVLDLAQQHGMPPDSLSRYLYPPLGIDLLGVMLALAYWPALHLFRALSIAATAFVLVVGWRQAKGPEPGLFGLVAPLAIVALHPIRDTILLGQVTAFIAAGALAGRSCSVPAPPGRSAPAWCSASWPR